MTEWTIVLEILFWMTVGLSLVGVVLLPLLVICIPADHYGHPNRQGGWTGTTNMRRHPVVVVVRNLLAAPLFLAGVIMLFTPGQGALMILVALSIATFPGKDRIERRIIALPGVLATLNMIRAKARRPPLEEPLRNDREKT
jgi:hypothetical protein